MSLSFSTSAWLTLDQPNLLLLNCSLPAWYPWRKLQAHPVWSCYDYVTLLFSGSFSFHLVPGFPITTCRLHYHSLPVPFCTLASPVLAEVLASYTQWYSVRHELHRGASYSPPFHSSAYSFLLLQRKSCLFLSKAGISICTHDFKPHISSENLGFNNSFSVVSIFPSSLTHSQPGNMLRCVSPPEQLVSL